MLSRARIAVTNMHRQLSSVRQQLQLPRVGIHPFTGTPRLPARALRNFHNPRRFQTSHEDYRLQAQSIKAQDSTLDSFQPTEPLTVLQARKQMFDSIEAEAHRIAGVTFENRQEVVQKLQAEEAVMLEKDPKNEYDPNAIRVRRLNGEDLGFVPKELTGRFPYDTTFGCIHYVGQVPESGAWGALVAVRPTIPPMTVDAIPENVLPYTSLSNLLSTADWEKLCRTTARAANYRCQISGGSGPDPQNPVQCQEVWAFDDDRAEMKLVGLQAVCPEVFLVKRLLRQLDDKTRQTAMWTLQGMNEWTVMEAEAYVQYKDSIARERSKKQWTVDLSWLTPLGVTMPDALPPGLLSVEKAKA